MKKRGGVAAQGARVSSAVRRDVRILMAAQSASTFGSFITRAALPLLAIIGLGISAEEAAFIAGVDLIAATLASQIAGVWIDRLPRRPVMIAADLLRALLPCGRGGHHRRGGPNCSDAGEPDCRRLD